MSGLILVFALVGQDVTPPVFLDMSVDPIYIDCRESDQVVTVYAEVSDDLAGIEFAFWQFFSPSRAANSVWFQDRNRIAGDDKHSWYATEITFSQYSEFGIWSVEFTDVKDRAGNKQQYHGDDVPFDVYVINGPLPIPEPSTIVLLAVCLAVAAMIRWVRSR